MYRSKSHIVNKLSILRSASHIVQFLPVANDNNNVTNFRIKPIFTGAIFFLRIIAKHTTGIKWCFSCNIFFIFWITNKQRILVIFVY